MSHIQTKIPNLNPPLVNLDTGGYWLPTTIKFTMGINRAMPVSNIHIGIPSNIGEGFWKTSAPYLPNGGIMQGVYPMGYPYWCEKGDGFEYVYRNGDRDTGYTTKHKLKYASTLGYTGVWGYGGTRPNRYRARGLYWGLGCTGAHIQGGVYIQANLNSTNKIWAVGQNQIKPPNFPQTFTSVYSTSYIQSWAITRKKGLDPQPNTSYKQLNIYCSTKTSSLTC